MRPLLLALLAAAALLGGCDEDARPTIPPARRGSPAAPVPEPGSGYLFLVGAGLVGLALVRRARP